MKAGINYFEISLHGHTPAVHDALAGRDGSFEEVVDAIINVKSRGGRVNTVFVATKSNIGGFREYVELNALLKVNWILFNRVACGGAAIANWADLAPSPSEIRRALDVGAPVAEKYKIGVSAGVQVQPCLIDLSRYPNVPSSFCPLNNPSGDNSYFAIDPAGNLRMCNRSRIILGSLLSAPFAEIEGGPAAEAFCSAVPDFCRGCKLANECAGGCKADAYSCFGALTRPDPYLEMWRSEARRIEERA
jgi:radical SAM protein with 4Fe4S-binding SPASM domain